MLRRGAVVVVMCAACASRAPQAKTLPSSGTAPAQTVTAPVACPAAEQVAARVRDVWKVAPDATITATCAPGVFPAAGWAIDAVVEVAEGEAWTRQVVLAAADGAVIADTDEESVAPWRLDEGGGLMTLEPIDLDGDGVSELIARDGMEHGGTTYATLSIEQLHGAKLESVWDKATHFDNAGRAETPAEDESCDATITFSPPGAHGERTIILDGTSQGGASDCDVGHHVYMLAGGKVTEQK